MSMRWWIGALLCLVGCSAPLFAQSGEWLAMQRRMVEIYNENEGALVRVKAAYESERGESSPQVIIGSGFFISNQGLVLTNASIVYNPARVWVEHRGVAYAAEVVGSDRSSNLALLRLDTLPRDFRFLHLTDSAELPPIGNFVIRLSMPLEFGPTPDLGMVAGFESRFGGRFFPCKYIRTSVSAAPGDGGAAYLDLTGRLVGLQVGSLPEVNSTYVLPSRAALRLRDDFLFSGKITYGWIGFEVREESNIANGKRLALAEIIPDTPAADSGLMVDDILLQIGDYPIRTIDDLRNAMFYSRVGQYVSVQVRRDGERQEFSVRLAERPPDEPLEVVRPAELPREPASPVTRDKDDQPLSSPHFRSGPLQDDDQGDRPVPVQKPN